MKPVRTWILVADAGRARVLENLGPGKGVHQLPQSSETWELPSSHELGSDRPGRSFESHGATRHAIEPKSDPNRERKRAFAAHLVGELEDRRRKQSFDRLVIVAAPEMLGDLRAHMPEALGAIVVGELAKDLTQTPTNDIAKHLEDIGSF
jgi:protein required for attachment to host cells